MRPSSQVRAKSPSCGQPPVAPASRIQKTHASMTEISPYPIARLLTQIIAGLITRWKRNRRAHAEAKLPIFDIVALEVATTPPKNSHISPGAGTALRELLNELNKRGLADKVLECGPNIAALIGQMDVSQTEGAHASILRMIDSDDKWLVIAGAQAALSLTLTSALPNIEAAVDRFKDTETPEIIPSTNKKLSAALDAALIGLKVK